MHLCPQVQFNRRCVSVAKIRTVSFSLKVSKLSAFSSDEVPDLRIRAIVICTCKHIFSVL